MPDLTLWASDDYVASHAAGAFRPLRLRQTWMRGADVYALQTALAVFNPGLGKDGIFGPRTNEAVRAYQANTDLIVDGVAGAVTQATLAAALAREIGPAFGLPDGVPLGHVEQESSGILGQYTPQYTTGDAAGSRDEGVVQCNTRYYAPEIAFDAVASITQLATKVRKTHEKYRSWVVADPKAWRLACGAWNAPAFTDRLARGDPLSEANTERILDYIEHVCAFADL